MSRIFLKDIEMYAHHGYYSEERTTGGNFMVNIEMEVNMDVAGETDELNDTYNYQHAYDIVKHEMSIPSQLLEHIATRIANRILQESEKVNEVRVIIEKMNPPLGGKVKSVGIDLCRQR